MLVLAGCPDGVSGRRTDRTAPGPHVGEKARESTRYGCPTLRGRTPGGQTHTRRGRGDGHHTVTGAIGLRVFHTLSTYPQGVEKYVDREDVVEAAA